jgi:hypothetical protein
MILDKKINYIYFSYENFTKLNLAKEIIKNCHLKTNYTMLVKIGSDSNTIYKMAGNQIGIFIGDEHDENYYFDLYELIKDRIEIVYSSYNYIDYIETIVLIFSAITTTDDIKLKNVNKYNFNKRLINNKDVKKDFNVNLLPLTLESNKFGIKIIDEEKINIINSIVKNNPNLDLINLKNLNSVDIHIYTTKNNKKKLILSKNLDNFIINRYIFDFNSKLFIKEIQDKQDNNYYYRKIGNFTLKFDKNKVYSYDIINKLEAIKPNIKTDLDRNIRIAAFDLETFFDFDGLSKAYALGFYAHGDIEPTLFFIDKDLDSELLIIKCIDNMLINKYNNFIFYVHNFARYDVIFIYNVLLKENEKRGFEYYNLKPTLRDDEILNLNISIKKNVNKFNSKTKTSTIKISLRDSMPLLNSSLEDLTYELEVKFLKLIFPHKFVNRNTLNYLGNKPDISYYRNSKKNFTRKDLELYLDIPNDN